MGYLKFWSHITVAIVLVGLVLPFLFSIREDWGPVTAYLLVVAYLTYYFDFITKRKYAS